MPPLPDPSLSSGRRKGLEKSWNLEWVQLQGQARFESSSSSHTDTRRDQNEPMPTGHGTPSVIPEPADTRRVTGSQQMGGPRDPGMTDDWNTPETDKMTALA